MKQAILITAYKDFDQLLNLVKLFDDDFTVYIHVDKKSKMKKSDKNRIIAVSTVKFFSQKYKVNWGGMNHLKAYLLLSKKALEDQENNYFHLITGQDFPIKNLNHFKDFLFNGEHKEQNYLVNYKLPTNRWPDGGLDRYEYYNFHDLFNAKTSLGFKIISKTGRLQKKLNIKRPMIFPKQLYGGSAYWTLTRNTLQFVMDYTKNNPSFLKRLKHTFCAEEIYFQTIIMNSEHAINIINNNLRFIDWNNGKDGSPPYLNEKYYDSIVKSDKLFARKIDSKNKNFIQMLTELIQANTDIS